MGLQSGLQRVAKLEGVDKEALDYFITDTLGYGYIGVNATYVNELPVRRAIMHAMDTSLCLDYYGGGALAELIYRPMSKTLKDYYPDVNEPYYEYDESGQTSLNLAREAGYTLQNGVLSAGALSDLVPAEVQDQYNAYLQEMQDGTFMQ